MIPRTKLRIILELLYLMDIKDFAKLIEQKHKELDEMMRRKMPVVAGRMAKDHFQNNFRLGGFVNGGLHPWPKSKRLTSGRTDAAGNYDTLLSGRNHLFKSIKYIPSDYRVKISNDVIYAPIHNWGGSVSVTVTDRMRRFAWAKYRETSGETKKNTGKKSRGKATSKRPTNPQAQMWKGLALTKKKKLNIHIPQRQFLGDSEELNEKIEKRIEKEIRTILNL